MMRTNTFDYEAASVYGSGRRFSAAADTTDRVVPYIKTLLMPFQVREVGIPDLDMTQTIMKGVDFSFTLTVRQEEAVFLILFVPGNPEYQIRIYVSITGGPFYFLTNVTPDQDLGESFRGFRVVSGGISVKSNTVSGSNFNVAGLINHVAGTTLPVLRDLTFASVLSYKKDTGSIVRNVGVDDGTVGLMCPTGSNPYLVPGNPNILKLDTMTIGTDGATTALGGGWITNPVTFVANVPLSLYKTSNSVNYNPLPPGTTGKIRIHYALCLTGNTNASLMQTYVQVNRKDANPVTYAPTVSTTTYGLFQINHPANTSAMFLGESGIIDFPDYESIEIFALSNVSHSANLNPFSLKMTVETFCNYTENFKQPYHLIAVSKMGVGQSLDIMGALNYEAIPDENLTQNITVKVGVENPMDMELAEALFATLGHGMFACVYPNSTYQSLYTSGFFEGLGREGHVWSAAPSLRRRIETFWGGLTAGDQDRIKALARSGLSGAGSAIGGVLAGPSGAAAGMASGEFLGRAFFTAPKQDRRWGASAESSSSGNMVIVPSYSAAPSWKEQVALMRSASGTRDPNEYYGKEVPEEGRRWLVFDSDALHAEPLPKPNTPQTKSLILVDSKDNSDCDLPRGQWDYDSSSDKDVPRDTFEEELMEERRAEKRRIVQDDLESFVPWYHCSSRWDTMDFDIPVFSPTTPSAVDLSAYKKERKALVANFVEEDPKGLASRTKVLSSENPPRRPADLGSADFVMVSDTAQVRLNSIIVSGIEPKHLAVVDSSEALPTRWLDLEYSGIAGKGVLRVETHLITDDAKGFFGGLAEFISATSVLGNGIFYMHPGQIANLDGDSHTLACLAALCATGGLAVYTGAVVWNGTNPELTDVGKLPYKLAGCVSLRRPLIFPLTDIIGETSDLLAGVSAVVGQELAIKTPASLIAGTKVPVGAMVCGAAVGNILEAWVAQNQLSIGERERFIQMSEATAVVRATNNPYKQEKLRDVSIEEFDALLSNFTKARNLLRSHNKNTKELDGVLEKLENFKQNNPAYRDDPTSRAGIYNRAYGMRNLIEQQLAALKAPTKKKKKGASGVATRMAMLEGSDLLAKYNSKGSRTRPRQSGDPGGEVEV